MGRCVMLRSSRCTSPGGRGAPPRWSIRGEHATHLGYLDRFRRPGLRPPGRWWRTALRHAAGEAEIAAFPAAGDMADALNRRLLHRHRHWRGGLHAAGLGDAEPTPGDAHAVDVRIIAQRPD